MIKKTYSLITSEPLYANSIFLMASTLVMAVLGFFFWIINARLFDAEQIGLATTSISVITLLSSISLLGLNAGLIRFLPSSKRKNEKINTSFMLVILAAVTLSIVYLLGIHIFSPKLQFIRENIIYSALFILIMVFAALNIMIENIFVAYRSTKYVLFKNIIISISKLVLPFLLISFGAYGIFISFGLSTVIACLLSILILTIKFEYLIKLAISKKVVKKMTKFSFNNYVAGIIGGIPIGILPILITNKVGATTSAYFYIGMMIANLIYVIPIATSQSFFAEGSYDDSELLPLLKKAGKIIAILMVPAILITFLFGNYILLAFGEKYSSEGFTFLKLIALAGVFVALNQLGSIVLHIRHKISLVIIVNIINVATTLSLSYLFISEKLIGVGIAWIIGQLVSSLVYIVVIKKLISF